MKISLAKQGPTNCFDSEVYRELERQARKDGFFDETPADTVRYAASQVKIASNIQNRESDLDLLPSENIDRDIAALVSGLRNRGYISQAQDVESNYIMFKRAESELYNISLESPMDLIDFAHPDGDINVTEIKGGLADIETIESAAAKILAVVNKQPTGKQPNSKMAGFADFIKKNAQENDEEQQSEDDPESKLVAKYKGLENLIRSFTFGIPQDKMTITFDNLSNPVFLNHFCEANSYDVNGTKNAYNKIIALKKYGFKDFSSAEFMNYINYGMNKNEQIKEIAQILDMDPNVFTGVSGYYMDKKWYPAGNPERIKETLRIESYNGFISAENAKSPYIQVFEKGYYAGGTKEGLKAAGYTINQEVVKGILDQMVAKSKELWSWVSNEAIQKANKNLFDNAEAVKEEVVKQADECVVPKNAFNSETGLINGNDAFVNMSSVVKNITTILTDKKKVDFINSKLASFDKDVPARVQKFLKSINAEVTFAIESVLGTKMISVGDTINSLVTAAKEWSGMPNGTKAQNAINEYLKGLRAIRPAGKAKPESLVASWLRSKGYKSGKIEELNADIAALIDAAKKESEGK